MSDTPKYNVSSGDPSIDTDAFVDSYKAVPLPKHIEPKFYDCQTDNEATMSDTPKHSPGPWEVVPYVGPVDFVYGIVPWDWELRSVCDDIAAVGHEADAQLIAAAPEMLETLKLFYDWSKNPTKYPPYWMATTFVDKCSEIIAKAEGSTP